MRHNQNRRSRSRNRKGPNPLTRSYESNGPDVKVRGTAPHVAEKYMTLARDAMSSGDSVAAENYLQHAEHYNRIVMAAQAQFQQERQAQFGGEAGYDEERAANGPVDRFGFTVEADEDDAEPDRFEMTEEEQERLHPRQPQVSQSGGQGSGYQGPRNDGNNRGPRNNDRNGGYDNRRNDYRNNRPDQRADQRGPRPDRDGERGGYNGEANGERYDRQGRGERFDRYEGRGGEGRANEGRPNEGRGNEGRRDPRGESRDERGDAERNDVRPERIAEPREPDVERSPIGSPEQDRSSDANVQPGVANGAGDLDRPDLEAAPRRRRGRPPRAETGEAPAEPTPDGAAALAAFPD